MMLRSFWRPLGLALLLSAPSMALAQGRDPAAAEALFQRGVEALKTNDWDAACKAFEGSMKLDPSVGTQINLARCAEHNGQVARAWADYKKAKALNAETPLAKRKANVDSFVDGEIKKLEARLPWVTLRLRATGVDGKPVAPSAIAGLQILRDDSSVPIEGLDVSVPIDPGKHRFQARAPGYLDSAVDVSFVEGGRQEATLNLVAAPPGAKPSPLPPPLALATPKAKPAEEETSPLLLAGIAIGSVGAAGLIVSGVTGGIAMSDRATLDDLVDSGGCTEANDVIDCDASSQAEAHDALTRGETLSVVSTVTLFAGAGLAATGIVLAVVGATSSSSSKTEVGFVPLVSPDVLGAVVSGQF